MALLPYALRPAVIIRRKAIRQGILGPSVFWKVVAGWVFGKSTLKKFFGKQPEKLGTEKVGMNTFANVIAAKPMSKAEKKKYGVNKVALQAQASADVAAARASRYAKKPSRKNRRRLEDAVVKAEKAQRKAAKKAS